MSKPDEDSPAFPVIEAIAAEAHPTDFPPRHYVKTIGGITLRQYYAAKAMQGILASGADAESAGFVSKAAYDIADAMIFFEKDHAQAP